MRTIVQRGPPPHQTPADDTLAGDNIRRSMEASITLGDERGIAMCLEKLGGIAIGEKQLEFAARMLGAAEALREARNTPVEGMVDYQRFVAQLREQLAENGLHMTWNERRDLPLSYILDQILEAKSVPVTRLQAQETANNALTTC